MANKKGGTANKARLRRAKNSERRRIKSAVNNFYYNLHSTKIQAWPYGGVKISVEAIVGVFHLRRLMCGTLRALHSTYFDAKIKNELRSAILFLALKDDKAWFAWPKK